MKSEDFIWEEMPKERVHKVNFDTAKLINIEMLIPHIGDTAQIVRSGIDSMSVAFIGNAFQSLGPQELKRWWEFWK